MERLFDLDLERALIDALLLEPHRWRDVLEEIDPLDFHREAHQVIYQHMRALYQRGVSPEIMLLLDDLDTSGQLEAAGGREYVMLLGGANVESWNAAEYARRVHRLALRNRGVQMTQRAGERFARGDDPSEIIAEVRETCSWLEATTHLPDERSSAADIIDDVILSLQSPKRRGISFGFAALDDLTFGMMPKSLWYLTGRPGSGKSALALDIAEAKVMDMWRNHEEGVVDYITLEMGAQEQVERLLASRAQLATSLWRASFCDPVTGKLLETQRDHAIAVARERKDKLRNLHLFDRPMNLRTIREHARRRVDQAGLKFLVLDYIALLDDANVNETKRISDLSRGIKAMARELNIPVLALAQMNREVEKRASRRPLLSDLRDSGGLEQDGDGVIGLFRPAYYDEDRATNDADFARYAEAHILKHRGGRSGTAAVLAFDGEFTRFYDWPKELAQRAKELRQEQDAIARPKAN